MNSFYDKYIKYKNKYLKLRTQKKQIGKGTLADLHDKITFNENFCIGYGDYFRQHTGECWNDAIQMLLCFSDEVKASVQSKLFNLTPDEIIDLTYLENREKYLMPTYRKSTAKYLLSNKFEKRLKKYLSFLQKRLCSHIIQTNPDKIIPKCDKAKIESESDELYQKYGKYLVGKEYYYEEDIHLVIESLPAEIKSKIESQIYDMDINDALKLLTEYLPPLDQGTKLRRKKSEVHGIGSAMIGVKIANAIRTVENHGASLEIQLVLLNSLSFCLLANDDVLKTDYVGEMSYLTETHIDESFGVLVYTSSHATSFYICDGISTYYNDNLGKFKCDWKNILHLYLEYKITHELILSGSNLGFNILFKNKVNDECLKVNNFKNILENTNVKLYEKWKEYVVNGLLFVKKINLKDKKENYIYNTLEDQFIMGDLLNNSQPHIKNPNNILYYLTKIDPTNMKIILHNMNNIPDKIIGQRILYNLGMTRLIEQDLNLFKLLMCSGVDLNYKHFNKITMMVILATAEYSKVNNKIIDYIADHGGNINEIYSFIDKTILELAVDNNNIELVEMLIKKGADINRRNNKKESIIMQLLKKKLISDNDEEMENDKEDDSDEEIYTDNMETTDNIVKLLIKYHVNLHGKDQYGKTVFELAIENMKLEILNLLIKNGVNINKKLSTGDNALFYMIKKAKKGINYLDYIKLLICSGFNINEVDSLGISPLLYIIINKPYSDYDYLIVKILLNAGANYTNKIMTIDSPIDLVKKSDDIKMKNIFESSI